MNISNRLKARDRARERGMGRREELREELIAEAGKPTLAQFEARGATGVIFGTTGYDVERELRAYAEVAGLR